MNGEFRKLSSLLLRLEKKKGHFQFFSQGTKEHETRLLLKGKQKPGSKFTCTLLTTEAHCGGLGRVGVGGVGGGGT